MPKLFYKILCTICLIIFSLDFAATQPFCRSYELKKCDGYGDPYKYSGQSRSATFRLGETSSFKVVTFGGYEYCVSLCADKHLKDIFFRILKDSPQRIVLFDSQIEGDDMLWKQFYVNDSKSIIVEVVVPKSDLPVEELDYDKTMGCVGVVIEYRKFGKTGF